MAKIEKLREDKIKGNGSKDVLYPETVGQAVHVPANHNNKVSYKKLPEILDKKGGSIMGYTATNTDGSVSNMYNVYYLFLLKDIDARKSFQKYLNKDIDTLRQEIEENGTIDDIRQLEEYPEVLSGITEPILLWKLRISFIKELVISYTVLHDNKVPKIGVIDMDTQKEYGDGDVINTSNYPLHLRYKLDGIPSGELASLIAGMIAQSKDYYGNTYKDDSIFYNVVVDGTKIISTDAYDDLLIQPGNIAVEPTEEYRFPLDHCTGETGYYTSAAISAAIDGLLGGGVPVTVHLKSMNTPKNQEEIDEQLEMPLRGNLHFYEEYYQKPDENTYVNLTWPYAVPDIKLTVIFNKSGIPVLISPSDDTQILFNSTTAERFSSKIFLKAKNVGVNKSAVISTSVDEGLDLVFKILDSEDESPIDIQDYETSIEVTSDQLTNGVWISARPNTWTSESSYCPFTEDTLPAAIPASETSIDITAPDIIINYDDGVIIKHIPSAYHVKTLDIEFGTEIVSKTITEEINDTTNRQGYLNIQFNSNHIYDINDISCSLNNNTFYADGRWETIPKVVNNIQLEVSTRYKNGTFENYSALTEDRNISASALSEGYISFRVTIPEATTNIEAITGKGSVYIRFEYNNKYCSFEIPFNVGMTEYSTLMLEPYNSWYQTMGFEAMIKSTNKEMDKVVNAVTTEEKLGRSSTTVNKNDMSTITHLDSYAFANTTLEDFEFMQHFTMLTEIPDYAFYNSNIESIVIPPSVKKIGSHAFAGCTNLASLTIPDSVEKLGDNLCEGCTGLRYLSIGKNIHVWPRNAFVGCTNITDIYLNQETAEDIPHPDARIGQRTYPIFDPELGSEDTVTAHVPEDLISIYETAITTGVINPFYNMNVSNIVFEPISLDD